MIEGLSHLTFFVSDLDRMTRLTVDVFDGREVYSSGAKTFSVSREKFFIAGGLWIAIMEGEPLPTRTYNHAAFKVADAELDGLTERIVALGLDIPRPRIAGEGRSVYFYDWDNHLFELHTGTLDERLRHYANTP
jgi:catechol 2,3-dioxygenase-like lactoylglutathione lyase family enzyme